MIELAPAPTATLRFLTVAELREQTPARPAWLWDTYIAAGNLTLLIGKPKAGKSTLALGLATARDRRRELPRLRHPRLSRRLHQ
jgi:hypothetical protein